MNDQGPAINPLPIFGHFEITAGDVQLPEGSELAIDPSTTIAVVSTAQTAEQLEGDTGEGEAPTEEPAAEAAS